MSGKTDSVVSDLKAGFKGIHGVGEAIRGTVNKSVDQAFHEPEGVAKNSAIAQKGEQDIRNADRVIDGNHAHSTTGSGVRTGGVSDTGATAGNVDTTGAGTHSAAVGNLGAQGAATGTGDSNAAVQEATNTTQRY